MRFFSDRLQPVRPLGEGRNYRGPLIDYAMEHNVIC